MNPCRRCRFDSIAVCHCCIFYTCMYSMIVICCHHCCGRRCAAVFSLLVFSDLMFSRTFITLSALRPARTCLFLGSPSDGRCAKVIRDSRNHPKPQIRRRPSDSSDTNTSTMIHSQIPSSPSRKVREGERQTMDGLDDYTFTCIIDMCRWEYWQAMNYSKWRMEMYGIRLNMHEHWCEKSPISRTRNLAYQTATFAWWVYVSSA